MSKPLTRRQENFARAYVETGDAIASYGKAYDVRDGTPREATEKRAGDVLALEPVQRRIAELKATKLEPQPKKAKAAKPKPEPTASAKPKKRPPVTYTVELGHEICEAVAMREALAEICARPGMPSERTVYTWRRTHPEFAAEYEEARRWRAEARADFVDSLSRRLEAGTIDPQTARTLFDMERWQAAKESPARYSDKTVSEITGRDGAPIQIAGERDQVETARRVAMLLSMGMQRLQDRKLLEAEPNE